MGSLNFIILFGIVKSYQTWKNCKEDFRKGSKNGVITISEVSLTTKVLVLSFTTKKVTNKGY